MAIDIMLAIAAVTGFYIGYSRGIIQTVFSVLSLVFGLMAAFKFATPMTEFLKHTFNSDNPLMFAAGFLLAFVIVMFLIRMIARSLEGILRTANINVINQLAGGVLIGFFTVLMYSILLWFGDQAHMINQASKVQSRTYVYLEQFPAQAKEIGLKVQPLFQDFWNQSMDMMDKLEDMSVERTESGNVYDITEEDEAKDPGE